MSIDNRILTISRRNALKCAAVGAGGALLNFAYPVLADAALDGPLVTTHEGKLRGTSTDKLNIFKGVQYGETTEGNGRFRQPTPVRPWNGIREATALGDPCFQNNPDWVGWKEDNNGSEDCLVLNIWSAHGSTKKPVMVFFHGGSYMYGSGGAPMYDAAHLAERGDVLAVTVNHRIHMLGFMHLAGLSADYKGCSNAGLLDLVEALRWIKRNIAAFGGDAENVTIFGESGGGGKVSCLLAMPAANGLFHRAIVQSGSQLRLRSAEKATADARAALKLLGVSEDNLHALESIPPQTIWDTYIKVSEANIRGGFSDIAFSPVLDPDTLPFHPGSPEAIDNSKSIPLLVGTNEAEGTFPLLIANLLKAPADEKSVIGILEQLFSKVVDESRTKLAELIDATKKKNPDIDPYHLLVAVSTELWMTRDAIEQAESRFEHSASDVYMYRFGWKEPCFGGEWATHAAELPFLFDHLDIDLIWGDSNLDAARQKLDPNGNRHKLRDAVIGLWSSFARDGKPFANALPTWPAYDTKTRQVMRLDSESVVIADPLGGDVRKLLASLDVGVGS
ncbi:carboxylesterase family protein [Rhizobium sp. NZLR1]|uniref:carboxylesterase/lipase family protein n=1 Tax=Rhizobium sp. NZLR1 TaxID=2731096 RepID=UPI001A99E8A4|nr:carboxylesterase family protein [Rhizobium sp. NZLR1]MBX5204098.1 carboxylesterase/lipase family protein [Rhizobium sp. NZLR1]QSZ25109.1 carboxylesterase/lipase family protein [Rhizobium sp. NZLR1]